MAKSVQKFTKVCMFCAKVRAFLAEVGTFRARIGAFLAFFFRRHLDCSPEPFLVQDAAEKPDIVILTLPIESKGKESQSQIANR